MITGSTVAELRTKGSEGSLASENEPSIGSGGVPGSGWSSVTCGGTLARAGSKGYVMVQNPLHVKKQQGAGTNLDRGAWNYESSWNDAEA